MNIADSNPGVAQIGALPNGYRVLPLLKEAWEQHSAMLTKGQLSTMLVWAYYRVLVHSELETAWGPMVPLGRVEGGGACNRTLTGDVEP